MSRTLGDLTAGTCIYVDETVSGVTSHVPYIYLGVDDNGNGRLLRQYLLGTKRMHSSNVASYAGCEMDLWLENTESGFLSRFDSDVISSLQNTTIKYVDYNQSGDTTPEVLEISRKCFLLSYSEMGYSNDAAGNEGTSFLPALQTFTGKTGNAAKIGYNESEQASNCWLRSAYSTAAFRVVLTNGNAYISNASYTYNRPRPALSVALATIVSDEGADPIFLLPEGRTTTWNIDMDMELGVSENLPTQAKVMIATSEITSLTIQISNNYLDDSPTWQTVTNNQTAILSNTEKTSENWGIGIKIHAESPKPSGYIGEPVVMIASE